MALTLASIAVCGCSTDRAPTAAETLTSFYDAVQERQFDRLYCLMAGAADAPELGDTPTQRRAAFEEWAQAYYDAYESGRDEGWVELDEHGLALVKLFSLGRGTFVTPGGSRAVGDGATVVETGIRFGYAHIDLSAFSPGTTFYVCGAPAGRVHAIVVPAGPGEISRETLESIRMDWTLVRTEPSGECPGGWAVAGAEPVEGTAATTEITWVF